MRFSFTAIVAFTTFAFTRGEEATVSSDGSAVYAVGRKQLWDLRFSDAYTNIATTIFYPADRSAFDPKEFQKINVLTLGLLPEIIRFQGNIWNSTKIIETYADDLTIDSFSYLDAPLARSGAFPLVHFFHADHSSHKVSISFLEHLASRGFIVVASDSPCSTPISVLKTLTDVVEEKGYDTAFCPNPLDVADYLRELITSSEKRVKVRKHVSPAHLTFLQGLNKVTMPGRYALIGHGRGALYTVYAGSRNGDVAVNIPLMSDPVFQNHFYCPQSYYDSKATCYHNDYVGSTPQKMEVPPWNFSSYFQVLAGKDSGYNSFLSLHSIKDVVSVEVMKGSAWINEASHSTALSELCTLALQNQALGTFISVLDPEFKRVVDECENTKASLPLQRMRIKEIVSAVLLRVFGDSPCAMRELIKNTNQNENYGAYFEDILDSDVATIECGSFGENPVVHDALVAAESKTESNGALLAFGAIFLCISAGIGGRESWKALKHHRAEALASQENNEDGAFADARDGRDTRTISAWTGAATKGSSSGEEDNPDEYQDSLGDLEMTALHAKLKKKFDSQAGHYKTNSRGGKASKHVSLI